MGIFRGTTPTMEDCMENWKTKRNFELQRAFKNRKTESAPLLLIPKILQDLHRLEYRAGI